MNVRITNIQNNYIITESTGYLLQKETVNTQQTLQVAQALS